MINALRFPDAFGDDSKPDRDETGLVVTAEVPAALDLAWLEDLRREVSRGRPVEYKHFAQVLRQGPLGDLCRGALRGISQATVVISDPEVYRRELLGERVTSPVWKRSLRSLPQRLRRWVEYVEGTVQRRVLSDSPLVDAAEMMGGETLEGVARRLRLPRAEWTPEPTEEEIEEVARAAESGASPFPKTNAALFTTRSTTTLVDWIDPAVISKVMGRIWPVLVYAPLDEHVYSEVLRRALPALHAFDEGDRETVIETNRLRFKVGRGARNLARLWGHPEDIEAPDVVEIPDGRSPHVQASDVAAGYARTLYGTGGTAALCKLTDFFRCVVFNGDLLQRQS